MEPIEVTVNGRTREVTGTAVHTSLLDWLRGEGLLGAKEGCAEGECGACAVLVARPDGPDRARWTAVNSCLAPVLALDGQEVVTAEGLGRAPGACTAADLHPVQREMAERGGSQCGYCTPGFVCSMAAEYYRPERTGRAEAGTASGNGRAPAAEGPTASSSAAPDHDGRASVPTAASAAGGDDHLVGPNGFDLHALSGNLCRCTGYRPIRDAAFALDGPAPGDPLAARGDRPAPPARPTSRTVAGARFHRPATLAELLAELADHPDAVVLAGATDLGVEVNLRHARPPLVLAVDRLPELRGLHVGPDHLEIGAALTLTELERGLGGRVPLLAALFPLFASRLIRNAATLGGNLGTGSPIGDAAPVLLALDAAVVLAGAQGERTVALADYFTGYRRSVREPGEVIRAVHVPLPLRPHTSFQKVAKRRFDDISSVAVAIAADLRDGVVADVRIGLGGVAATPLRAHATEEALRGRPWTARTAAEAAAVLATEGTPLDDHRASARYRRAMLEQSLLRFHAEHGQTLEVAR
ncbi:MAG TPA: FAD binding domain-containing protein [Phototrophicaceae bacterium]|nr:FAD binding domain-containing protein [Phototrophicaceae bacterium]